MKTQTEGRFKDEKNVWRSLKIEKKNVWGERKI
jgi:hypothetical protein